MRPHIRNCWFDGWAYLCAAEHLARSRHQTNGTAGIWMKADRWTSCKTMMIRKIAGNPLSAKAKAQLVIQGQHCLRTDCSKIGGSDSARDSGVSVFLQIVSSMGWCRSLKGVCEENLEKRKNLCVVCLSMRKILEQLKSHCPLRRLHVVPMEEAGETASSTWGFVH